VAPCKYWKDGETRLKTAKDGKNVKYDEIEHKTTKDAIYAIIQPPMASKLTAKVKVRVRVRVKVRAKGYQPVHGSLHYL